MISTIKISNTASYDSTGIEINNLNKVNYIYGVNGSGKTTISNFLTNGENFPGCSTEWENNEEIDALVYNKKFRENNLNNSSIEGVFTLGQATTEEKKVIEDKQQKLETIKQEVITKKNTLDVQKEKEKKEQEKLRDKVWDGIYKKHEFNFKEAFKGYMQKELFKSKLLSEFSNNNPDSLTFDELEEKASTIFGEQPEAITFFEKIDFDEITKIENQTVWNEKILGKSDVNIAQLIQTLNLNDWVNKGREYLQNNETCPFCQQETITEDFRNQLESYFDESFIQNIKIIKESAERYKSLIDNLINQLELLAINEKDNQNTKIKFDSFSASLKTLSSQFNTNNILLNNKIKEPSRSIELTSTQDQLLIIKVIIQSANDEIKKHNKIVNNFQTEKDELIKSIWRFIASDNIIIIDDKNLIDGLNTGIQKLTIQLELQRTEYSELDAEIKQLTQNVTSIQPTIDSINITLKSFGFLNFEIVPSKEDQNKYQIQRENGDLATETLSEGEITFITFLYFVQLTKGSIDKNTITNDRILVVDDPVSSLDSNVLFIVSTLLKEIIEKIRSNKSNIKQILILTHNVYFHKDVSFIHGRNKERSDTFYWILRQKDKVSSIQCFGMRNPIKTSYDLLWQELKNHEHNSDTTLQNIMRRIIEHYFKILGQYGDDDLIKKFDSGEDQEICRSLLSWVNDGSHAISDDLYIEKSENISNKYLKIFESIFEKTKHMGHYNMMMNRTSTE